MIWAAYLNGGFEGEGVGDGRHQTPVHRGERSGTQEGEARPGLQPGVP